MSFASRPVTGILSRQAVAASGFVERYVLSLVYLFVAWSEFNNLARLWLDSSGPAGIEGIAFIRFVKHMTLLLLQLFIGVLLLFGKRPASQPRNLQELLVPLAASFFLLTYNAVPHLPASLRENLLPLEMQMPCAVAALVLGIVGAAISTWGVASLGRSFGIFVAVREIVLEGPYRHVRHPIYLGYFCIGAGLVLVNASVAILVIVPIHVALLIYRAHLEEIRLAESSESYREYMQRTGFIFPRLRGAKVEAPNFEDR